MKVQIVCAFLFATLAVTFSGKVIIEIEREKYIVLLKEGATDEQIEEVIQIVEGHEGLQREELFIESDNTLLPMIFGEISEETAGKISELDIVEVVEKDEIIYLDRNIGDSNEISIDDLEESEFSTDTTRYNLDIIDDVKCKDGTYDPFNYGKGVDIYILDSGINYDHIDFGWRYGKDGTRATYSGYDVIDAKTGSKQKGKDCNGHGTHCAGIAGGLFSGVAKDANLISIRVMPCKGSGNWSWIMSGLRQVNKLHGERKKNSSGKFVGSIASMSIGGGESLIINRLINKIVEAGVVVVTASGNQAMDACLRSPGSAGLNINVGAHGYYKRSKTDCIKKKPRFSNYGPCVDIMAPGITIKSAVSKSNTGFTKMSGTSMACPHVAGLAALMKKGEKNLTPSEIKERIKANGIGDIGRSGMSDEKKAISHAKRMYVTPKLIA